MTIPTSELQSPSPGAIIQLFSLELNQLQHGISALYGFHPGTNANGFRNIVWAGIEYQAFPIEAEGFEYNGNGQLPRPKVRVSNALNAITALLATLPSGLEGAKFTRIRTLARYLDDVNFPGNTNPFGTPDPTVEFPREIYYVDRKSLESRTVVEFELAASFDLAGVKAPKRQCLNGICSWVYRSSECGYTGASYFDENDDPAVSVQSDVCGKRLNSCQLRFGATNPLPYGGFPGIGSYVSQ